MHYEQIFDVTIKKRDYEVKNLIVMQKTRGLLTRLSWTCEQDNCLRELFGLFYYCITYLA